MLPVRQQQAARGIHVLKKARNAVDIDAAGRVARQSHNNGNIGMVAFAGQGQGTVNIHHYASDVIENFQFPHRGTNESR